MDDIVRGSSDTLRFLTGGGEVGALMREHDWATTSLGAPESWPQSLRTTVELMLASRHAMMLAWGPELTLVYNDAYAPILGQKHPWALGRPFQEVWSDVWSDIEPLVAKALAGEALWFQDLHLVMERNGYPEDTWWQFSYSPVRDDAGRIAGMLNVTSEMTGKVLAEAALRANEKRQAFLLQLSDALRPLSRPVEIQAEALRVLGDHLGASRVHYAEIEPDGEHAVVPEDYAPTVPNRAGRYRLADFVTLRAECRAGRNFVVPDLRTDPRLS